MVLRPNSYNLIAQPSPPSKWVSQKVTVTYIVDTSLNLNLSLIFLLTTFHPTETTLRYTSIVLSAMASQLYFALLKIDLFRHFLSLRER